ncbi:MAG: dihydrofolate reductase [Anaerolineales bacterium]|nr:dihydrofolate reductase [Anaerolineales bacterium]
MADATQATSQTTQPTSTRKLTAGLFISLDGVTESPEKWQFDHFDEDMMTGLGMQIAGEDIILLGRVTYQQWSAYWPNSTDEPYASHINKIPKIVVSTTLDRVSWGQWDNVTLIKGNLAEELARLKQQPGKNITVAGSATLTRSLLQADLLDELTLMVHPVIVGRGQRLFDGGGDLKRLQLVYSKATRTGVMILTYRKRDD